MHFHQDVSEALDRAISPGKRAQIADYQQVSKLNPNGTSDLALVPHHKVRYLLRFQNANRKILFNG
jgi:hypothetical protein